MRRVLSRVVSVCILSMMSVLALSAEDMPAPHPKWSEKSREKYSVMDRQVLQGLIQAYFTHYPQYLAKADRLTLETLFVRPTDDKPLIFSGLVYNLRVIPPESKKPDIKERSWVQLAQSPNELKRSWDFVTQDDALNALKDAKAEEERFNQGVFLVAVESSLAWGNVEARYMSLLGLEGGPLLKLSSNPPEPMRVVTPMGFSVKPGKRIPLNVTFLAR